MDNATWVRTTIAGAVAAAALAVGGIAMATATEGESDPSSAPAVSDPRDGHPRLPGLRRERLAAQLAEELGIDEERVEDALEAIRDERRAEREDRRADRRTDRRERLVERLDAAVADGTLTTDDKASVLVAFDAEVLGGRPAPR